MLFTTKNGVSRVFCVLVSLFMLPFSYREKRKYEVINLLRRIKAKLREKKEQNDSVERELEELKARMRNIQEQIYNDKDRRLIKHQ